MFYGVREYAILVTIISLAVHLFVRRYVVACVVIAVVSSIVNLAHETWLADFDVNLAWGPFMLAIGTIFAFPVAAVTGISFAFVRACRSRSPQ